ncbi:hypothetical protein AWB69_06364 [Caballeronia udeis]|uniref:DUF5666 domain-containing protein n=1 Tax=Caballeronia udeis TaxID=1232866 RepID=A0A163USY9_9BURK|nr:hypothetical protein [Caballeronia udeis]SAP34807.1 hypothetical protein AWB69_06364 [Caballeronia udeis]
MNAKWTVALSLALLMVTAHVSAQTDQQLSSAAIQSALNAPPKQIHAQIVGIDPVTRTLTLKGAKGRVMPVVIGKEVTNFDALKIGDRVDVQVRESMLVRVVKASAKGDELRKRVDTEVYAPASGSQGFGAVHETEIVATVQSINNKNKTITLRGPWRTETFDLSSEIAAYKLKPGDTVHAVLISATAVEVTPTAK